LQRVRILLALFVVGVVGAGAAFAIPAIGARSTAAKTVTIKVTATDFKFKLSRASVPTGTTVIFKVTNKGKIPHDFKINGKKTQMIKPGETKSVKVVFKKKGRLTYICTVTGHAKLGMTGKFAVGVTATITNTTTTTTTTTGGGGGGSTACSTPTTTVNVRMRDFAFDLDKTSVPAGCIQFVIFSVDEVHNFDLQGKHNGALLGAGQTETWAVQLTAGSYRYVCDVGQHQDFGMVGSLTVT
jgi:plastocyanin